MTRHIHLIASLLLTGLAACGGADESAGTGDDAYATESATIAFGADWSIKVSGTLVAGAQVRVQYDSERLPTCRGDFNGEPGWTITGYHSLNGAEAASYYVDGFSALSEPPEPLFLLEGEGELSLWFQNTSRWGCSAYDSNFGENFNFLVGPPQDAPPTGSTATLRFGANGEPELSGRLVRGGELRIDYDPERLTECRGDFNGGPGWTITGYSSIGGSEPESFYVAGFSATGTIVAPIVSLDRAGELELWFQNTSRWGCSAYDSDEGANYRYSVE